MQCHISQSLEGLDFRTRYGMREYFDSSRHLYIFGMYRYEDLKMYLNHKSDVTVIWQGMDAKELQWIDDIKRRDATHISISHWIKESLDSYGIENIYVPASATIPEKNVVPRGDHIYFYSSDLSKESQDYYGEYFIPEIVSRTGLQVIRASINDYSKDELRTVYTNCFINLRLTSYDGSPNTNLEMGLMGRRSIFNGNIPHSIKWKGIDDICESIMSEYGKRHEDNSQIAEDIFQFINQVKL